MSGRQSQTVVSTVGCLLGVFAFLASTSDVVAFRGGPPAAFDGSPGAFFSSCHACHGNTAGPGSVQVLNFPAKYQANATYNLIVRITDATRSGAGFQASVQAESGSPAGLIQQTDFANTQLNSQVTPFVWRGVQHSGDGVDTAVLNWVSLGNAAEYSFAWQAPSVDVGPVTIWAAGNAINNDLLNTGDLIYLAHQSSTFQSIPRGACCNEVNGNCTEDQPQPDCEADGGRFGGEDSSCASIDPPCLEPTGACCDALAGDCSDDVAGSACVGSHLVWNELSACSEVACDAAIGACCDHDPFGVCLDGVTLAACECATCEWVEAGSCGQLDCDHSSIPAVSDWGVVVLALLLLIGAKVWFGLDQHTTPAQLV